MVEGAGEKVRILIVDDSPEFRENIRKLLQFESDFEIVDVAGSGEEALERARETEPDVVLMDINLPPPGMNGIAATEALLKVVPWAQIVVVSISSDTAYIRQAMLVGARFFIPKPPATDELVSTIRQVAPSARELKQLHTTPPAPPEGPAPGQGYGALRPEGRVIAVYSAKGGVGVTTLATNLAIGLNTGETPAVLVDTCMQFGDVSVFLNLQVKNSIADLAARVDELEADVVEEVLMVHESGLRVLAAPQRPELADEVKPDQVRRVLQYLRREFAYVIVDTHSAMDDMTLAVLDVADLLVAVATPDIPAIKDARLLFDLLVALEFSPLNVVFVLNKMDRRWGITSEAVGDNLKHAVDAEIPYDERTVIASVNRGVPLLMGDKSRPPARNILDLMGTIKQRLVAKAKSEEEAKEAEHPKAFSR